MGPRQLLLASVVLSIAARVTAQATDAPAAAGHAAVLDSGLYFPRIEARLLTGRKLNVPDDLDGELNIVIVAFKRGQQPDVDSWMPFLKGLVASTPDLRAYELPVLPRSIKLMRHFIDGGMRKGIADSARRSATMTAYIDKRRFKSALGIESEDRIFLYLVARGGRITWRADGAYTAERAAGLTARLASRR